MEFSPENQEAYDFLQGCQFGHSVLINGEFAQWILSPLNTPSEDHRQEMIEEYGEDVAIEILPLTHEVFLEVQAYVLQSFLDDEIEGKMYEDDDC